MNQPLPFGFFYFRKPAISVTLTSHLGYHATADAVIDTGADVTLFDAQYAVELGIDLGSLPALNLSGVGGLLREAKLATIAVRLLGHSDLEVMIEAVFADDVEALHGNLLGLDVLEHFDFALSHHQRLGSLGRALT